MYDKDDMAGMTAGQKAAVLKGKQTMNKDKMAKLDPSKIGYNGLFAMDANNAKRKKNQNKINKLAQGNSDMGKTIGRLESRADRSEVSAKYRLAKMKADKKMSKPSKTGKMLDNMEMKNAPRKPFMTKAKKGNK
jgi:hypothetical protein